MNCRKDMAPGFIACAACSTSRISKGREAVGNEHVAARRDIDDFWKYKEPSLEDMSLRLQCNVHVSCSFLCLVCEPECPFL